MKLIYSLILVPALLLGTGVSSSAADSVMPIADMAKKSHNVPSTVTVDIISEIGDVVVRTWDEDRVLVRTEAVHSDIKLVTTDINGCVTVEVTSVTESNNLTNAVAVIYVPNNAMVRLQTVNGYVTVDDTAGSLRVVDNRLAVDPALLIEATSI